MTKPDKRVPNPTRVVPRATREMFETIVEMRNWLGSELGTLAYLNTVATANLDDTAVTFGKIANIATDRILGRVSGGSGETEELTPAQVTTMLNGPVTTVLLGSDHSVASTTATEVTGLQATGLVAGTYTFQYFLFVQTTSATVGLKFGINYTGTATRFNAARRYFSNATTAATGLMVAQISSPTGRLVEHNCARLESTTAPNMGPNTGAGGINVDTLNIIEGVIEVSDAGDLELWHGSETAVATSVESGSSLVLTKVG